MIKLIDLTYYTHTEYTHPEQVLNRHKTSLGYIEFLKNKISIEVIRHLNYKGQEKADNVLFSFFKSNNRFFHIPFKTHKYIKGANPDVVLVQGLGFPVQIILLRWSLPAKCKIIVQHHGEIRGSGFQRLFQKIADKFIDVYLFTATGNAQPWVEKGIISHIEKCHEVLEASTFLKRENKHDSRIKLGITGNNIFLWVGRLETKKDPLTVLKGFEHYLRHNTGAQLYMIYQEDDLLPEVEIIINNSNALRKAVHLIGEIAHNDLPYWFSAADFYLSGSHKEAAGYALIESMACGCIPVVTNIPPFKKICSQFGFFFEPGNSERLYDVLIKLPVAEKELWSERVSAYFKEELSFKKIAEDIYGIITY